MPTRRQHRINELVLEELQLLIPGRLDDPRLAEVTVTRVESTQDLSTVKVYYTTLTDPDADGEDDAILTAALKHTEPVLRAELARLGLRRLPHLVFARDKAYESGQRVLTILSHLGPDAGAAGGIDLDSALTEAAAWVARSSRIWIGAHADPDGDAIGSLLGAGRLLTGLGKSVTVACADPAPPEVAFLEGAEAIQPVGPGGHDLAICLDTAEPARLGSIWDPEAWEGMPSLVIDHHISNSAFGTVNAVDPQAASTAELVALWARYLGAELDATAASQLLAGMLTDTFGFRTSNTVAETLRRAADLVDHGAPLSELTDRLFATRSLPATRLLATAVSGLEIRGTAAVAALSQADFEAADAAAVDARGIASFLATVEDVALAVLARERPDGGVDLSFRGRPGVDVLTAAQALGGGGHPQAAGARLPGPLPEAITAVWAALDQSGTR